MYRCWHRGKGCKQPRRTNTGLHRAAVLAMRLVGRDEQLQVAIRRQLARGRRPMPRNEARRRHGRRPAEALAALSGDRRKLLELFYRDQITPEFFAEEERRLSDQMEAVRVEAADERRTKEVTDEVSVRFEEVAGALSELDVEMVWSEATEAEKRILVEELVEEVCVFPDHLEVVVAGAGRLNMTLQEVGLAESQSVDVVPPTPAFTRAFVSTAVQLASPVSTRSLVHRAHPLVLDCRLQVLLGHVPVPGRNRLSRAEVSKGETWV